MDAVTVRSIARLPLIERQALASYAARASWPAGFLIYQRGASADGVFFVMRGRVVLRSRVRAGRGYVPWIATAGESFGAEGLAARSTYVTDARADEETETLHLSGARFRSFLREQPQHALAIVGQVMAERSVLLEKLRELTTLSVEQRLLSTVLRMAKDPTFTTESGQIVLCAARYRLLCELVGATRESVSLVLGRLVGEGLVRRDGSNFIVNPSNELARKLEQSWGDDEAMLGGLGDAAVSESGTRQLLQ